MKKYHVITNKNKDREGLITDRIISYLKSHGCSVVDKNDSGIECVVSVGGDGTLIKAAREMADKDVSFLGVNMGTVGFLTEVEPASIETSLDKIFSGNYHVEERLMLRGRLSEKLSEEKIALNDIVLSRTGMLQIIEYNIYVNDSFLASYRADGVIISTPTGSTGYNLSAGGPIVEPGSKMMVITPISAHTLNGRSVVLGAGDVISIEANWERSEGGVVLSFDGEENISLTPGQRVIIDASDRTTKFLRLSKESFVTALSRKLM